MKSEPPSLSTDTLLTTQSDIDANENTFKIAFLVTLPVFMSYACCFSLQRHLSFVFGLTEGVSGDSTSFIFGIGCSFVYFFNLIFRVFGHNLVFGCLPARGRVICALSAACISMAMLSILSFSKTPPSLAWVFIAYSFCGVCEGSFGPNMLDVVAHLGNTRSWVLIAMPTGVATISLIAFASIALGCPFWVFYIISGTLAFAAIFIYLFTIYPASKKIDANEKQIDLRQFCRDLVDIAKWFPQIAWHSAVFIVNMVCLGLFNPGCTLYAYQSRVTFRLFGNLTISHDWFVFIYNVGTFLGDFISRKVMEKRRLIHPIWYFVLLVFGFGLNICLIPEIAPLAAFMFSWANGGLYSQSARHIDESFPHEYHLTAMSTWLFIGDAGSTTGSNLVQPIRIFIDSIKARMY